MTAASTAAVWIPIVVAAVGIPVALFGFRIRVKHDRRQAAKVAARALLIDVLELRTALEQALRSNERPRAPLEPPLPAWTPEQRDRLNGALELKQARVVIGYIERIRGDVESELVLQLPADRTLGAKAGAAALAIHADCGLANLRLQMIARDSRLDPERRFGEYGEAFESTGNFPSGELHPALQELSALLSPAEGGELDDSSVDRQSNP